MNTATSEDALSRNIKARPTPKYKSLGHHIESMSVGEPVTGCWLWTGAVNRKGYGKLTHNQVCMEAHRASYLAFKGCADGLLVCHDCDQPSCVNPAHLYAGTYKDNRADMLKRSRWTHPYSKNTACFAGHIYEEGSYRIATDGSRTCKVCMRQHLLKYRKAKKEQS